MDLYMSIENIRFNNEINYIVDVDKKVNTDTIKVPPLILQPFLENAIWHGLSSKKGVKKIHILSPGFSSDCLETLEELEVENKKNFLSSGGEEYNYINCLNDDPQHIKMLVSLILNHLRGWIKK